MDARSLRVFSYFWWIGKDLVYRIGRNKENDDNVSAAVVWYQNKFLKGKWWKKHKTTKGLLPAIGTGPVLDYKSKRAKEGSLLRMIQAMWNVMTCFDNTPVNIWDYSSSGTTTPQKLLLFLKLWKLLDRVPSIKWMRTFGNCTPPPLYSLTPKDSTYNVGVELGISTRVTLIKETANQTTGPCRNFSHCYCSYLL